MLFTVDVHNIAISAVFAASLITMAVYSARAKKQTIPLKANSPQRH